MSRLTLWIQSVIFVTKRVFGGGNPIRDITDAHVDPLTGIANRKKALDILSTELAQAGDTGAGSVTVAFIDLDGLKKMNDTQGHEAGDEMLKSFVDVFPHYFRRYGEIAVFARLGGDEFLVATTMSPSDFSKRMKWVQEHGGTSFSFGVTTKQISEKKRLAKDEAYMLAEKMIEAADKKMYEDKTSRKAGRDFEK